MLALGSNPVDLDQIAHPTGIDTPTPCNGMARPCACPASDATHSGALWASYSVKALRHEAIAVR